MDIDLAFSGVRDARGKLWLTCGGAATRRRNERRQRGGGFVRVALTSEANLVAEAQNHPKRLCWSLRGGFLP